jgi:hypothetical protein
VLCTKVNQQSLEAAPHNFRVIKSPSENQRASLLIKIDSRPSTSAATTLSSESERSRHGAGAT